ncbi:methyltransferase, partial [Francisella tularensis subsp. holarctica]|nr:methyltransferase [Francisella tularensis subsp. holarctica]
MMITYVLRTLWENGLMNKKIEEYYDILSSKIKSPYETRNKSKDFS